MKTYTIPESALKLFSPDIQEQIRTLHQEPATPPNLVDKNVEAIKAGKFKDVDVSTFENIGQLVDFVNRHGEQDNPMTEGPRSLYDRFIELKTQKQ